MGLFSDHKAKKEAENMGAMVPDTAAAVMTATAWLRIWAIPRRTLRRTRFAA